MKNTRTRKRAGSAATLSPARLETSNFETLAKEPESVKEASDLREKIERIADATGDGHLLFKLLERIDRMSERAAIAQAQSGGSELIRFIVEFQKAAREDVIRATQQDQYGRVL
jgi:hypothetical protein